MGRVEGGAFGVIGDPAEVGSPVEEELCSAPLASGGGAGYTWSVDSTEHAVCRGVDGHIHELWFNGSWHHGDLTAIPLSRPAAFAAGATSRAEGVRGTWPR